MAKSRKIYVVGEINAEMYEKFSSELSAFEAVSHTLPVTIELSSEGGAAYDAIAFRARMRLSPCPINVTAVGIVASAAVLILAAGDFRVITKETWAMVHEDTESCEGFVHEVEKKLKHARRLEDQWAAMLETETGTSAWVWTKYHREETYLTANECKQLKLVDKII